MIKIPATPEGIPAIEESIANGININITLIFSNDVYAQVMEAYLRGLERRVGAGAADRRHRAPWPASSSAASTRWPTSRSKRS